jgi:ADP-ribose pyrophosphatase YjhB (NUDIX family)
VATPTRYCINCGIPLQPRLIESHQELACPTCDFVLWRDPKVVTLVAVEHGEGLLLGRRGIHPGYGLWCLPGGFVNHDEHPQDAAVRECMEEICAEVEILGLLGVYHIPKRQAASMVGIGYRARLRPGAVPAAGSEMLEVATFGPATLPDLAFPSHAQAVSDWRRIGEYQGVRER